MYELLIKNVFINFSFLILEPGSWVLKIFWGSHYTTTVLAMMITLVFWVALYPSEYLHQLLYETPLTLIKLKFSHVRWSHWALQSLGACL